MQKDENPFVISGHICPEYFCDRQVESAQLTKMLRNGNNVVLISDRRMGKTGLIDHCFGTPGINDNYYTFFADILHTTCLQELTYVLGRTVYEQTVRHGKQLTQRLLRALHSINGKLGFDPVSGLPTFSLGLGDIEQPEYTLEEIFNYMQQADRPCIVAIDEFQQIGRYAEKNIEALLRGHIQRMSNCHFVFAGSERHMLGLMFESSSRPFYKSADTMSLGPIGRDIYSEFIVRMFDNKGRTVSRTLAEMVYDLFEGHTYYVQKTMNEAFSNTPRGGVCTEDTLVASLHTILDNNTIIYRETLSHISLGQKMLLYAIAIDGTASKITSTAFIRRHKLSSASSVQASVKKLKANDLIVEQEKSYRISDRFLSLWLRRMMGLSDLLKDQAK